MRDPRQQRRFFEVSEAGGILVALLLPQPSSSNDIVAVALATDEMEKPYVALQPY
jgi:hypothetical protein